MKWERTTGQVVAPQRRLTQADREHMRIVIPSAARPDGVKLLEGPYPNEWLPFTYLCVPESEAEEYKSRWPGIKQQIHQDDILGISAKRQHIWDRNYDVRFVCMLDDDLTFAHRFGPRGSKKLIRSDPGHVLRCFDTIYRLLAHGWLHVGVSARGGNNNVDESIKAIGRMQRVNAHRHHDCKALGVRWDRGAEGMEDFDVILQLLRLGHPNAILYEHTQDQGPSNAPGGCAEWRTPETQESCANRLHELHPDFVSVVERPAGNWQGFGETRMDVRIQWKKAFESWPGATGKGVGPGTPPLLGESAKHAAPKPHAKKALKKKLLKKKPAAKKLLKKKTLKRKGA